MDLLNFLLQEQNLQIMERGLLLLKSHIESFKRRFVKQSGRCCFCSFNVSNWKLKTLWVIIFLECLSDPSHFRFIGWITVLKVLFFFTCRFAFHLRLWWLEGRGITCHQQITQRPTEKHYPIRVLCQPAGLSDKVMQGLHTLYKLLSMRRQQRRLHITQFLTKHQKLEP